ncbi:putative T7SS-secreted protein [Streptomyces sp. TR02-1]|uniref:putative T7SS-secreted protein n=1 Tax=Streptomyces sp. TR02-1 TaxID=3385977 RepID=UPI0039A09ED6
MATGLGATRDPKELIPGNAGKLHDDADKLDGWSTKLEGIGDDLGAVRVPGWTGKASDAFWDDFSGQKKRWIRGSDALSAAATALRSYADMLSWAQGQASQAIDLYDGGDESGAESMLESARSRLESEGDSAAEKFKKQGGSSEDAPDWLFFAAQEAQKKTWPWQGAWELGSAEPERLRNQRSRPWGPYQAGPRPDIKAGVTAYSAEGGVKAWGADAEGREHALGGDFSGKAGMNLLGADAKFTAGTHGGNAVAEASGKAYLAQGSAEGKYEAGVFEASGKAEGMVGAQARAQGIAGKNGVHGEFEAFAGAKAAIEGHASVAGVGVGGTAEAWAGVGVDADLDLGYENGKFVVGGELGAALGVGAKLGGSVEIDPGKVADAAEDAADAVGDWASDGVDAVSDWFD